MKAVVRLGRGITNNFLNPHTIEGSREVGDDISMESGHSGCSEELPGVILMADHMHAE